MEKWIRLFTDHRRQTQTVDARLAALERQLEGVLAGVDRLASRFPSQAQRDFVLPDDRGSLERLKLEIESRLSALPTFDVTNFEFVSRLPTRDIDMTVFRLTAAAYASAWSGWRVRSRFSDGTYPVAYFAEDLATAVFEIESVNDRFNFKLVRRMVALEASVRLHKLIDLTDPGTISLVNKESPGLLQAVTRSRSLGVTQQFGRELVRAGADACIYPTPNSVGRRSIVIFLANLRSQAKIGIVRISPLT